MIHHFVFRTRHFFPTLSRALAGVVSAGAGTFFVAEVEKLASKLRQE